MRQDLDDHRGLKNRGDDLQGAAAVRAVFEVDLEDALEQPGPADARRPAVQSVFVPDVVLHTTTQRWHGLDDGAGHAQSRDVRVQVSGRRVPKPTQHCIHHVG